jgi:exodeoxyribonuclease V gamma subunit
VAREPLTGEELSPSSVVEELLHAVERGYLRDAAALRRRHPLRRWDALYFPEFFVRPPAGGALGTMRLAEAHAEARTLALRESADYAGRRLDPEEVLLARAADPAWGGLAEHLGLVRLLDAAPVSDARIVVPMHAILKFLEFPLQGWARYRVGLDEVDDDDPAAREDEPFETDVRREVVFLREVLLEAVARGCPVEQAYDDAVRGRELRGAGPSGLFARGERGPHLATLSGWCAELEAAGESLRAIEVARFGRAGEHARAGKVYDALVLDLEIVDPAGVARMKRVEIGGRTLPMGAESASSITLVKRPKQTWDNKWNAAERDRAALRAFLDHAVLSATGVAPDRPHASLLVVRSPEETKTDAVSFAPLSRDEATVWLRSVVRELLEGPHAYFLPCEAVFVHARENPAGPVGPSIERAREMLGDKDGPPALRSAYGPVPRPQDYPAPDEARAAQIVASRFGAFFRKLERSS